MSKLNELHPIEMQLKSPAVLVSPKIHQESRNVMIDRYNRNDWKSLKNYCEITITGFVNGLPSPVFSGSTTFAFYYGAIAYKQIGEKLKYQACLKILYSLDQFYSELNEIDQELIKKSVDEYLLVAEEDGVDVLNNLEVKEVLKKSSGCFIATAVYGSEYADEVVILKEFRDNWLQQSFLGRAFIKIYYFLSPSIANQLTKHNTLKEIAKKVIVVPVLKIANNLKRKEN